MKVLVDNSLGPQIAQAIHGRVSVDGHEVVALRARFAAATPDAEWIRALGAEGGWAVLSGDYLIMRRPTQRLAWHQSRLKGFFLAPVWRKWSSGVKSERILLWWPELVVQERLVGPGAIFQVPVNLRSGLIRLRVA